MALRVVFFSQKCLKLGGSGRPTHLAPRGALALKPYLRTLNAELATLEGITPKLQVINQAEMDQVRLGKRMCLGESPDLGGRVRKRRSCSCCWLVFFVGGGGGWGVRMSGLYQFYFWLVGTNIQLLMVGD